MVASVAGLPKRQYIARFNSFANPSFYDVRMQVRVSAYSTHLQNLAWRRYLVC